MNEERGKECSEVSNWYNIPGHSAPVPSSTCEHMLLMLVGTGVEWPGILNNWRLLNALFFHLLVLLHQCSNYI